MNLQLTSASRDLWNLYLAILETLNGYQRSATKLIFFDFLYKIEI